MIIIELIYNLSVLAALSVFSAFLDGRFDRDKTAGKILQGVLFGAIAVIGMLFPVTLVRGLIFDGRTVVISLCSLFYGPFAGGIASLISAAYRMGVSGPGLPMGLVTITTAWAVGSLYSRRGRRDGRRFFSSGKLYRMGLLVHAGMLMAVLFLPADLRWVTFRRVGLTILAVYPFVTILIGKILLDEVERKEHQASLRRSAERYRTTLSSIGEAVVATERLGRVEFLNPVAAKLAGLQPEEAEGLPLAEAFPLINENDGLPVEDLAGLVLREKRFVETPDGVLLRSRRGADIPIAGGCSPIQDGEGRLHGAVFVFRDITELKLASERIVRDLEDKNALLREIHHRVKNNMQVIISLFHLRLEKIQDEAARREFADMEKRIHAMSRAQELLYRSGDCSRLALKPYLAELVGYILAAAGETAALVRVRTEVSDLAVDVDTADRKSVV